MFSYQEKQLQDSLNDKKQFEETKSTSELDSDMAEMWKSSEWEFKVSFLYIWT